MLPRRACGVYLLHLSTPLSGRTARHYIGSSDNATTRIRYHARGKGARFTRAAVRQQIPFEVVRFWPTATYDEAYALEVALKRAHHHARLCPVCQVQRSLGLSSFSR